MASIPNHGEEKQSDFGSLLESYYDFDEPQRGDIRDAEILQIHPKEIVVDLGVKRDGVVPPTDIERLPQGLVKGLKIGDVIPVYVINPYDKDGNLVVSINLGMQGQDWDNASALLDTTETVDCKVFSYNKGGLLVQFGGIEGFVPTSHLEKMAPGQNTDEWYEFMESWVGETLTLRVIEVNQKRRRLIFSQKNAGGHDHSSRKELLLKELSIGDIVQGTITGIRDFGVFVNIGGADGLIHVSELAWHRVPHPNDIVSVGDQLDVYVLELDHEQQRIALSLRRTKPDPWELVEDTYQINDMVEGIVSNVVDFGAFVVLDDGIEGLLHVTEMGDGTLTEPHSYLQRGDTVTMRVVSIEKDRKRIGFTQKNPDANNPQEEEVSDSEA